MDRRFEDEVRAAFAGDAPAALVVLAACEGERVQRAVLKLANGDLALLRHNAERARQDFRDVLMWAEASPAPDEPRTYAELLERLHLPPDVGRPGGPPR